MRTTVKLVEAVIEDRAGRRQRQNRVDQPPIRPETPVFRSDGDHRLIRPGAGVIQALSVNRPGFVGGSHFQIGWSRYEQNNEQILP